MYIWHLQNFGIFWPPMYIFGLFACIINPFNPLSANVICKCPQSGARPKTMSTTAVAPALMALAKFQESSQEVWGSQEALYQSQNFLNIPCSLRGLHDWFSSAAAGGNHDNLSQWSESHKENKLCCVLGCVYDIPVGVSLTDPQPSVDIVVACVIGHDSRKGT